MSVSGGVAPGDLGAPDQICDHRFRVGQPVPVVVPRSPPVQIRREPHLVIHQTQPFPATRFDTR